jgi:Family of unknown function (DUF5682)
MPARSPVADRARAEPALLGVRHHGPGSARAVARALAAYRPDVVLIEGPPEADGLVELVTAEGMAPPVALLAYTTEPKTGPDGRRSAAYWPFAEFSPEWQALRWAVEHGVPVRFCDLPVTFRFAPERAEPGVGESTREEPRDPIGLLAGAAGYDDPERWWEDVVEHQLPAAPGAAGPAPARSEDEALALAPFQAIAEAMAAVRAAAPELDGPARLEEDRREAHMRVTLRAATKQFERVAVVCGAWHVPALTPPLPTATADASVLRGLSKTKVTMTWVPWTHGRLAYWQGYGAGVDSPGWYHHLFTAADRPVLRWLVAVASVLRQEDQPVSSAHVIEAVRLAETLATLRGRPLAGLAEVTEATRAVLCDGDELRLALVNRRLVVGERLGTVPEATPSVPLVGDLAATQRRLKLTVSALVSELDLDLRRDIDLNRSRLIHRLRLLGIDWGTSMADGGRRGKGTFWESWRLAWRPEFAVDLIEASGYGTTVPAAATARTAELAAAATSLADVTALAEHCLLADLADAYPVVLRALDERVALDAEVAHLMAALPSLARTLRYGDVRGTDVSALGAVTRGLVVRVCVGLPAAVAALDDDAAAQMRRHLDGVNSALALLSDSSLPKESLTEEWLSTLDRLAERDDVHGLLAGRLIRLLLDAGRLETAEVGRRMGLVLTVGTPPARAAAWVEGFFSGGGLLLVHDQRLLSLVDSWLAGIPDDVFGEVLPLLRRTFAEFAGPERRAIGERVRHLDGFADPGKSTVDSTVDSRRGALVGPTLRLLLGQDVLGPDVLGSDVLGSDVLGSDVRGAGGE